MENKSKTESSHWFWGIIARYRSVYINVLIASALINLFVLTIPLFIMNVYDRVIPNNAYTTLWVFSIGVLIVLAFDFFIKMLRSYFLDKAGKKMDLLLSSSLIDHSLNTKVQAQTKSIGERANQLKEFEFVREFLGSFSISLLVDIPFVFLFLFFVFLIGGSLVFIPLIGVSVILGVTFIINWPLNNAIRNSLQGSSKKSAVIVETLSGMEEIKSTHSANTFLKRWQEHSATTSQWLLKARFLSSFITTFVLTTSSLIIVGVIVYGVYLIGAGNLTMGGLIACTILSGRTLAPLNQFANFLTKLEQVKCSYDNLNTLMDAPIDYPKDHHYFSAEILDGTITFKNVEYYYPKQPSPLFKDLNFHIKKGEHVAIIGNMGSGKSTLLKLASGLYTPQTGSVLVGGVEVLQINPDDKNSYLGYLAQDPKIFSGTILQNLTLRNPEATEDQFMIALKRCGIDHLVTRHSEGLDMRIGENGIGLSGGQKQALALARTIVNDPEILLLDEPTASMDAKTERAFIDTIKHYFRNKTLMVATHKMGILEFVDRIIIMQEGKIYLDGSKETVLAQIQKDSKGPNI